MSRHRRFQLPVSPLELRLLTSVVDTPAYLRYYYGYMLIQLGDWGGVPEPEIRARFMNAMARLFQQQYLVAERVDDSDQWTDEFFTPTIEEIEAGLRRDITFTYQLTPRGSQVWERYARPNWAHYLLSAGRRDVAEWHTLTGAQKTLVQIGVLLDSPRIVPGTLQWQTIEPWPVTYWKELPIGYEVSYQIDGDRSPLVLGEYASPMDPPLWPPSWHRSLGDVY